MQTLYIGNSMTQEDSISKLLSLINNELEKGTDKDDIVKIFVDGGLERHKAKGLVNIVSRTYSQKRMFKNLFFFVTVNTLVSLVGFALLTYVVGVDSIASHLKIYFALEVVIMATLGITLNVGNNKYCALLRIVHTYILFLCTLLISGTIFFYYSILEWPDPVQYSGGGVFSLLIKPIFNMFISLGPIFTSCFFGLISMFWLAGVFAFYNNYQIGDYRRLQT
ncbi:hypothetical protein SPONL_1869 [uncultured Candidatus Thioglobus sp.]|nr:hypothetical protein SPONL_1869 [uncultured Candidatus Thioglobus sp.]